MEQKFFLYIIKSKKNGMFYTGVSKDLQKRLLEHNRGKSKYSKHRGPYELVYFEEHETRSQAAKREYYLKSPVGGPEKKSLVEKFGKRLLDGF